MPHTPQLGKMALQSHGSRSPDDRGAGHCSPDEPSSKRRKLRAGKNDSSHTTRRKTACQSCRMKKVKCDAIRPTCGICKVSATACEYTDPFSEKLTLESATELLCNKINKLQDGIDNLHGVARGMGSPGTNGHINEQNGHHFCDPDRPQQSSATYVLEPSKDFLQIPAHRTTADTALNWEVFEGKYPPMALVGTLFTPGLRKHPAQDSLSGNDLIVVAGGLLPADEEQIPLLVDKFLENVHTKNPVLDVEQLVKQARTIASNGLRWDGWSCLVLLASALGTICKPFDAAVTLTPNLSRNGELAVVLIPDASARPKELQQAESYFVLASRRLGSLQHSILGSQCYFFAGVYLMYTLRPLLSWQYFTQASVLYQLYMKTTYGVLPVVQTLPDEFPAQHGDAQDSNRRRVEESLYWSCFKSETEFRVELPLPQTELATSHPPQMFPSPPSPAGVEKNNLDAAQTIDTSLGDEAVRHSITSPHSAEHWDLRQHAKRLCNEEESWYYYLTEIALRRIGNRIINTFFSQHPTAWVDIKPLLGIALEFDTQVSAWSAHLPAAMQHWETNYTIRAPSFSSTPDGTGNYVSQELSWATDNRLLEMRSWLYQPFMYYLIHYEPPVHVLPSLEDFILAALNRPDGLNNEDAAALYHFITSGIECNLKILDVRSLRHRHHGLWYDLRSLMCASLILLAVVKSGHEAWMPGGAEALWGSNSSCPHQQVIGGKIGHAMTQFDFWSGESPDLVRHREVLEDVTRMVQTLWSAQRVM